MQRCARCGTMILFGPVREGQFKFCSYGCREKGVVSVATEIPPDVIEETTQRIHKGPCPQCGQQVPVDYHGAYRVWSCIILTSWKKQHYVVCRGCAFANKLKDLLFTFSLGWWGIPAGIVATPIFTLYNLGALMRSVDDSTPSNQLKDHVAVNLAMSEMAEDEPGVHPS